MQGTAERTLYRMLTLRMNGFNEAMNNPEVGGMIPLVWMQFAAELRSPS